MSDILFSYAGTLENKPLSGTANGGNKKIESPKVEPAGKQDKMQEKKQDKKNKKKKDKKPNETTTEQAQGPVNPGIEQIQSNTASGFKESPIEEQLHDDKGHEESVAKPTKAKKNKKFKENKHTDTENPQNTFGEEHADLVHSTNAILNG